YWSSLVGGALFTFANYHFAHAQGHLQLVALEWLPLFLLCWQRLLVAPGMWRALAAAGALLLVQLCDYYYFFYCVLAGGLLLAWHWWHTGRGRHYLDRARLAALAVFAVAAAALTGPLPAALFLLNRRDPLGGEHPAAAFSLDLLAPAIPGGHWRFASLTAGYWSRLPGNIHESSVQVGVSVLLLLALIWARRRDVAAPTLHYWYLVGAAFGLLALGPVLHVAGRAVPATDGLMPYALLARAFPPLRLAGMPVRMVVLVQLGAAMICALGLPALWRAGPRWRALTALLLALAVVEYLPAPLPESHPAPPPYLAVLQARPDHLAVLDTATDQYRALYYQTLHGRPLAFGYVSRLPASVAARDAALMDLVRARRYDALARAGFGYLILPPADAAGAPPCAAPLYRDAATTVYAVAACAGPRRVLSDER
ncbi:MAG TPA: hypothetical protein VFW96_02880, partial [Thermomicrobiales bacterium]|nr:hypothetical protein [Thermomicrobiales bacterium]